MIHFYKKLYVGDSISKKRSKILWKLRAGKIMPTVYCIALDDAPNGDMLDIYHNAVLRQPYYRRNKPYIMGIAGNYEEAVGLVETMLADTMAQTGSYDVRLLCPKVPRHTT